MALVAISKKWLEPKGSIQAGVFLMLKRRNSFGTRNQGNRLWWIA